jgi:PAS domain S-box-containing protein
MGKITAIDTILLKAVNASSESIVITDPNQEGNPIIFANKVFEELTGYAMAEILGRNCRFLQGDDHDQPGIGRLRSAVRYGTGVQTRVRNYRKDGSMFINDLAVSPVHDAAGRLQYFIGVQHLVPETAVSS